MRGRRSVSIYLVPLTVVAVLAFITLISTTRHRVQTSRFGYNTFELIAVITALFFVLALGQGHFRRQPTGQRSFVT